MKLFLRWWSDEIMEHPLTAVQVLNLCAPLAVVFMILIHSNLWLLLIIWWHDTKVLMTRHGQIYCSWAAYRSSQMTALLIMAARRSIISMQYKFRWSKISCSGVLRWVTNLTTFLGRPDQLVGFQWIVWAMVKSFGYHLKTCAIPSIPMVAFYYHPLTPLDTLEIFGYMDRLANSWLPLNKIAIFLYICTFHQVQWMSLRNHCPFHLSKMFTIGQIYL